MHGLVLANLLTKFGIDTCAETPQTIAPAYLEQNQLYNRGEVMRNRGVIIWNRGKVEEFKHRLPEAELPVQKLKSQTRRDPQRLSAPISLWLPGQRVVRGRATAPAGLVLGHEQCQREILEAGRDVEYIKKGDLVSVPFNIACKANCTEV